MLWIWLVGCARGPIEMHLDDQPSPWLTLHSDGRIVAYTGEVVGTYDAGSGTVAVPDADRPYTIESLADYRRKCTRPTDDTFRCEHQTGHIEPWRGRWEPAHDALFAQLWLWEPPQPVLVRTDLWERGDLVAEGRAAIFQDGTVRADQCRVPFIAGCSRWPDIVGRWTDDAITLNTGETVPVSERVCRNGWCAERRPAGAAGSQESFVLTPLPAGRVVPSYLSIGGQPPDPRLERVGFALAAHFLLGRLDPPHNGVTGPADPPAPPR